MSKLQTVWFWRDSEDSPELLVAWDDYDVDQNPEGYEEAILKAYDVVRKEDGGNGLRRVNIIYDADKIAALFDIPDIDGEVSS